ncbi:MAG: hypothetical protein IPL61_28605 [Myxococcales bacterium]|nr:hypothetical protein [Myxococcales bacterium]
MVAVVMPYATCPLCDGTSAADLGEADLRIHEQWRPGQPETRTWLACDRCAHVFADGWWTAAGRQALRALPRTGASLVECWPDARAWAAPTLATLAALRPGPQRVLVVGASARAGGLVAVAAEHGHEVLAIDDRPAVVAELRDHGFTALAADDVDPASLGRWEVVILDDVLARAPWPRLVIADLTPLVAAAGVLVVTAVVRASFAWRVADARGVNGHWAELEYLHLFTRAALEGLLLDQGWRVHALRASRYRRCGLELFTTRSRPHA